ncbi:hypothetical protein PVAND_004386 [Polypedilum vanderplanki]|uniref:G-protein coupled receptors family 1 profile domain-containing protein n=1 Tax=Polypedilum vanderplanki TaxID=319348 RepID=A0A9J6BXZ9_POLVA|nr:hypothetical protein PVAND_004386 [Polypedilum vanderplanki]
MSNSDNQNNLDNNEDEFLYEFLERRPTVKFFYALFVIFACIFGLLANSLIIYLKLRKFKNRSSFDLFIVNIAIGMNLLSIRFILIMIEETTHDIVNIPLCYSTRLSVDVATPIIITTLLIMIIFIKYNPNVKKETELKVIIAISIYSLILALPVYNMRILTIKSWNVPHKICFLFFNDDDDHIKFLLRLWISLGFKIFLPMIIFIIFFITLKFNFTIGQYRNYWIYSIVISVYYFIFSLASILTPLISLHFKLDIGSKIFVYFSFNMLCFIVALNPITLWHFDRDFSQETIEYIKYKLQNNQRNEGFNEIVFDEKNMQNVNLNC